MKYKELIIKNAKLINELNEDIKIKCKNRDKSVFEMNLWSQSCLKFHKIYSELAFLGGILGYRDRLRNGEINTIEYALEFLEMRPYFFRSGYIHSDLLRVLKNCELTTEQMNIVKSCNKKFQEYKLNKKLINKK